MTLTLASDRAEVTVVPEMGAGLGHFRVRGPAGWVDVLRPWSEDPADGPFALASNLLVPWSGRISGGGFAWEGRFHALKPNVANEPFPIHGDGFQRAWTVAGQTATSAEMTLDNVGPGPYRYHARVAYRLDGASLEERLDVRNAAATTLPYGLGFHPWFRRAVDTRLFAPARRIWLEDARHLPDGWAQVAAQPERDFADARALPASWVNNLFTGWDGRARIDWPDAGLTATIAASAGLRAYILYSPSGDADFFCFEPVSHLIDAHSAGPHWPDDLGPNGGLAALAPGETLTATMTITVGSA